MNNQKINPFLMFNGKAEEAINFYTSIFDESKILHIFHREDKTVLHAKFILKGQVVMAIDNNNKHEHPFTPAMSLFVTCDNEQEINTVFERLSQGGKVLMPLAPIPFSEKFGWVEDKYGVSWQLNLPEGQQ